MRRNRELPDTLRRVIREGQERRERELRILWRTCVLLLRYAERCEDADERAATRATEREVRRMIARLEAEE